MAEITTKVIMYRDEVERRTENMINESDESLRIGWEKRGFSRRGTRWLKPTEIIRRGGTLLISKYSDSVLKIKGEEWKISGSEVKNVYSVDKRARLIRTFGAGVLGIIVLGASFSAGNMEYAWIGIVCFAAALYHFWLGHYKILVIETAEDHIEIQSWDDVRSMQALREIISNADEVSRRAQEERLRTEERLRNEENKKCLAGGQTQEPAVTEIPAVIYCGECGTKNSGRGLFCKNCGEKLYKQSVREITKKESEKPTESVENTVQKEVLEHTEDKEAKGASYEDLEKILLAKDALKRGEKISKTELFAHCKNYLQKQELDWNRLYQEIFPEKDAEKTDWTEFAPEVLRKQLKRGYFLLEEKDWEEAGQVFDKVLDQEWECAEAYLGKYLVDRQICFPEEDILDSGNKYYQRCMKFAGDRLKEYLFSVKEQEEKEADRWIYLLVLDDRSNEQFNYQYHDFGVFILEIAFYEPKRAQEHMEIILKEKESDAAFKRFMNEKDSCTCTNCGRRYEKAVQKCEGCQKELRYRLKLSGVKDRNKFLIFFMKWTQIDQAQAETLISQSEVSPVTVLKDLSYTEANMVYQSYLAHGGDVFLEGE